MSDYKKELEYIKSKLAEDKIKKAKLEERLENLQKEQKEIWKELKEKYDISDKETLESKIKKLEEEINKEISQCKEVMKNT